MLRDTENFGIIDPELEPESESVFMDEAIERFKEDSDIQAIYSEYAEVLDDLFRKAREKYSDKVEDFEVFVADFLAKLKRAIEEGEEIIDIIDQTSSEI